MPTLVISLRRPRPRLRPHIRWASLVLLGLFLAGAVPLVIAADLLRVRIMSFNIWCDGRTEEQPLERTVEVIRAARADIVGLQESKMKVPAIARALGFRFVQQGEDTAILSRFPIVGVSSGKRGVRIRPAPGRDFLVFNVHLYHAPYQPYQLLGIPYEDGAFLGTATEAVLAARKARGEEVDRLLAEISGLARPGLPVFVTGDFNEPSHLDWTDAAARAGRHPLPVVWPATRAMADAGFQDSFRTVFPDELERPGFTWTPTTSPSDPNDHHDRIDFVFHRGPGIVAEAAAIVGEAPSSADLVVSPFPSDHRAVAATFRLDPSRSGSGVIGAGTD